MIASAIAQPTIHDCAGAIQVCQPVYHQATVPTSTGNVNDLNPFISCQTDGEVATVWYQFSPSADGDLGFDIASDIPPTDYDWSLYNITNTGCEGIFSGAASEISCNVAYCNGLATGANGSNIYDFQGPGCGFFPPDYDFGWSEFNDYVPVQAGQIYVLCVNNWSGPGGYTLDFTLGDDVGIFDTIVPQITSIELYSDCSRDSLLVSFSEHVLCNTLEPEDFAVVGPGGAYTISTIISSNCLAGTSHDDSFILVLDSAITVSGEYDIITFFDEIGDAMDLCSNPSINVNHELEISIDTINVILTGSTAICDGETTEITVNPAGMQYNWSNGLPSSQTVTLSEPGWYYVTVSDNACASSVDSILIEVDELEINLGNDTSLCEGALFELNAGMADSYLWSTGESTAIIEVGEPGVYEVTVDLGTCSGTDAIEIEFTEIIAELQGSTNLCNGETTDITVNPTGMQYQWNTGSTAQTITLSEEGWYYVTISENTCEAIDSIFIQVDDLSVDLGNDTSLCEGSLTLDAGFGDSYLWNSGQTTSSLDVNGSGTYSVTVSLGVCIISDSIDVNFTNVNVSLGQDTSICTGGTASINAIVNGGISPYEYIWSNGLINSSNISISPINDVNICITITDNQGCESEPSCKHIEVLEPLQINAIEDIALCENKTTFVQSGVSGGLPPYTIVWYDAFNTVIGNGTGLEVTPLDTSNYLIEVGDNCETPLVSTSFTINVLPAPEFTILADTLEGCPPLRVNFNQINLSPEKGDITSTIWYFGDNITSTSNDSIEHVYNVSGDYTVSAISINDWGCETVISQIDYIDVYPQPSSDFVFTPLNPNLLNPEVVFTSHSEGANSWTWFVENTWQHSQQLTHSFTEAGDFEVILVSRNQFDCTDTLLKRIQVDPFATLFIPNSFSPNGDRINDEFIPKGVGINDFKMSIFNRYGKLIFESDHLDSPWDGTYKGSPAEMGVYSVKLKYSKNLDQYEEIRDVILIK